MGTSKVLHSRLRTSPWPRCWLTPQQRRRRASPTAPCLGAPKKGWRWLCMLPRRHRPCISVPSKCVYLRGRAIPAAHDKHAKAPTCLRTGPGQTQPAFTHAPPDTWQQCASGKPGARGPATHQNAMTQLTSRCSKPKRSLACCSTSAPPLAAVTPSSVHWKFCFSSLSLQTGRWLPYACGCLI